MPDSSASVPTAPPRPLIASARAAFRTLLVLAVPGCLLTTMAYFTSTPVLFAQLSPFRVQYAVLLTALVLVCLASRRRRWATLFLAFTVFNAWAVIRPALPSPDTMAGETTRPSLKILLANVLTSNPDPAPLLALVAAEKPDLIALLEVNRRWQTQLSATLLSNYPHVLFHPQEDNFGLAILSRIPPTGIHHKFFAGEDIPSLDFTLSLAGRPIQILLTHPLPPGGTAYVTIRDRHLSELAGWVTTARHGPEANSTPVLILGDLNSTPWCPPLRHLLASTDLHPAMRGHSWIAPTWPVPIPFLRVPLDHALLGPSLACTSYRVGPDIGSDHFPLILEVCPRLPIRP